MTTGKTVALSPEEWKSLCILNAAQMQAFLQMVSRPTQEHFVQVEAHLEKLGNYMRAWALSYPRETEGVPVNGHAMAPAQEAPAEQPKRKGGWPKGKKRVPRNAQAAA